jgi:hypothetical protein
MDKDYANSFKEIIKKQHLVSFDFEPMNDLHSWGFVLACNDTFTLINYFSRDKYALDGYSIFYNDDVSEYWVYTEVEDYLETKYVKLKNIKPQPQPSINLGNLPDILSSIAEKFPLMKIYRDNLTEDGTAIGKLVETNENTFKLLAMRTDAKWKDIPSRFRYADITRIDFGSSYEDILLTVADNYKQANFKNI